MQNTDTVWKQYQRKMHKWKQSHWSTTPHAQMSSQKAVAQQQKINKAELALYTSQNKLK